VLRLKAELHELPDWELEGLVRETIKTSLRSDIAKLALAWLDRRPQRNTKRGPLRRALRPRRGAPPASAPTPKAGGASWLFGMDQAPVRLAFVVA
jgi:hypothetical protein